MKIVLHLVQLLFTLAPIGGFWLWWVLDHVGHGLRPEGGFLRWWHDLEGQPEFFLLFAQLAYPLFWWLSRKVAWTGIWRTWRTIHLWLVLLLLLAVGIGWLATPDLGGHWG